MAALPEQRPAGPGWGESNEEMEARVDEEERVKRRQYEAQKAARKEARMLAKMDELAQMYQAAGMDPWDPFLWIGANLWLPEPAIPYAQFNEHLRQVRRDFAQRKNEPPLPPNQFNEHLRQVHDVLPWAPLPPNHKIVMETIKFHHSLEEVPEKGTLEMFDEAPVSWREDNSDEKQQPVADEIEEDLTALL